jgi:hypothetical protein
MKDAQYYPWVESIHIHDNTISGGGATPNGNIGGQIAKVVGKPLPDILYDGLFNPEKLVDKKVPDALRVCLQNNASATFADFDAGGGFKKVSRDLAPHNCALPPLEAVVLPPAAPPATQ